ncbi:hypothetical protein C8R47DRAFT_1144579 [Mycena vitilis]|nr:hypothetical protein C8R47DRAFT_1144579 [Mycena vitilis]
MSALNKKGASSSDVSTYLVKKEAPAVTGSGANAKGGPPLTMAQYMRASNGEPDDALDIGTDTKEASPEVVSTVFMEDLQSYKVFYDNDAPCGVADVALQDPGLRKHYLGLPPLPAGRRIVAAYDKDRNSHEDIDYSTGGRVKYKSWYKQNPRMLADNSMGAMLLEQAEPNFVNLSRTSPVHLSTRVSAGSASTHRLYSGDRIAICVSAVCCTDSHVVAPKRIGAKSDRERKWVEGVLHDQDWERLESTSCLCFNEQTMYSQITGKAVQFQTMLSPDPRNAPEGTSSRGAPTVPSHMFSASSPKKAPASKSRSFTTKTLLAHNDTIPVYDARKTVVNYSTDLGRLDQVLPLFPGEIPSGSFTVVGYTMSSYMGLISGGSERVPHLGFNILWAIVCGTPAASSSRS